MSRALRLVRLELLLSAQSQLRRKMAERFFKKEVQKLYLGAGQKFRGEAVRLKTLRALANDIGKKLEYALAELTVLPGGAL